MTENFYEKFKGKDVAIIKTDGYIKRGIFLGNDDKFIFLKFNDGTTVSINFDSIQEIKENLEERE